MQAQANNVSQLLRLIPLQIVASSRQEPVGALDVSIVEIGHPHVVARKRAVLTLRG